MGKKHGVWFDLLDHISIHKKVLDSFSWLIRSGDTEYTVTRIQHPNYLEIVHDASFFTNNGFYIEIKKRTKSSAEDIPKSGMTVYFSYNCFKAVNTDKVLQYHCVHDSAYKPNAPWHNKPHRHQFIQAIQNIDVYSYDHRPHHDVNKRYSWSKGNINLNFLDHGDWPYVKEFLDEVSLL